MERNIMRDARGALAFTQEEMAALLGVSRSTIIRWERGLRKMTTHHQRLLERLMVAGSRTEYVARASALINGRRPDAVQALWVLLSAGYGAVKR